VDAHNAVRAAVTEPPGYTGIWAALPAVTWADEVAASAQVWANHLKADNGCQLVHEQNSGYGENLAASSGEVTPEATVQMWADELASFTYTEPYAWDSRTGHYTQLVWRESIRIGCGSATCGDGATVTSCRYAPAGNIIGGKLY
jgi:pathogenesis-related protein 1